MAHRKVETILKELKQIERSIVKTSPMADKWDWIIRRRNELLIELKQAEVPLDQEPAIGWKYLSNIKR